MLAMELRRHELGWSQAELARRAGMHPSSVCAIERGRLTPYPAQARKLAEALAWDGEPAGLFEGKENGR